jgi:NAD(P)H-dependent FMN reductase
MNRSMETFYVPVLLGSVRRNRESIKVACFALDYLQKYECVRTELLDLKEMNLPIMEERLRFRDDPPPSVALFSSKIDQADSILIVTPEYNGGYPGVLKNALEYLKTEYLRKPFGIITVSAVATGGVLCLVSLRQVVLQMGGLPIPASLLVPQVQKAFDGRGEPCDPAFAKQAREYFDEFLWFTEALAAQRRKGLANRVVQMSRKSAERGQGVKVKR